MIELCAPYDKMNRLTDFLRSKPRGYKCIVFCGTKRMCDQVRSDLWLFLRVSLCPAGFQQHRLVCHRVPGSSLHDLQPRCVATIRTACGVLRPSS
jgi:hypothetical protein